MRNLSAAKSIGSCLSAFIERRCFEGMLKAHRDGVRERKITLKLHSRTPSLLQDCASLPALLGLNCGILDKRPEPGRLLAASSGTGYRDGTPSRELDQFFLGEAE
jgi:hypothetical protein